VKVGDLVVFKNFTWIGVLAGTTQGLYATVWLIRARPNRRAGRFISTYLAQLEPLNESRRSGLRAQPAGTDRH